MVGTGRLRRGQELASLAAVLGTASLVAFVAERSVRVALVVACLPLLILLCTRPVLAATVAVGLLPLAVDIVGGGPAKVSLPDLLMLLALATGLLVTPSDAWRPLKAMLPLVGAYAAVLLFAVLAEPVVGALVDGVQRLQIVLVPLAVGGVLLRVRQLDRALSCYVATASLLAVTFALGVLPEALEFQKNPVGQYIAGAILVVAFDPTRRLRLLSLAPLAYGLFQTQSRGAVLGLLVGLAALLVARQGAERIRAAALLLPVLLVLGLSYASLPDDVQRRTTTLSADAERKDGQESGGEYTIEIRKAYRDDALRIVRSQPLTGVGIGNYRSGVEAEGTLTNDPHNVLLLEAAEGGVPLAIGFLVLVVGATVLIWTRRGSTPLAPLAMAVHVSIVSHGLVDVYWVRGTPVLGWLLVGAVLADAARRRPRT